MAKLLALLLLFANTALSPCAFANGGAIKTPYLTDEQLRNAEFVSTWLKTKATTTAQKDARPFLEAAMRAKNSSAAAKAFLESIIRYPHPQALVGYAVAETRMLGEIRARNNNVDQYIGSDMLRTLDYYKSAIAADAVLQVMPKNEMEQVQKNAACLTTYLRLKHRQKNCLPLQNYLAKK